MKFELVCVLLSGVLAMFFFRVEPTCCSVSLCLATAIGDSGLKIVKVHLLWFF